MKALRLSPSTRRQERSGTAASLLALGQQLCLELELCVQQQQHSTDLTPLATDSSTCLCQRIGHWLGHATNATECSTCDPETAPERAASLLAVRGALGRREFGAAIAQAAALLAAGAAPDETDAEGRTLLSHSVQHLDDAAGLTRLLLNSGASVWPLDGHEHTPFTWLLRALILRRRFENCDDTLRMLAAVMAERPPHMRAHVLRVMFRHGRCPKVLGPVFRQVKEALAGHWTKPSSLQSCCVRLLRRRLGATLDASVPRLGLPPPLQRRLLLLDLS